MAQEGTYEYECMRAELLGIEKPDYEEFMKKKSEREEAEMETVEIDAKKELNEQKEYFGRASNKLDELGNILKSTQKKINIITAPFSTYFKSKIGRGSTSSTEGEPNQEEFGEEIPIGDAKTVSTGDKKKDILVNNVSTLDDLIDKADRHTMGMEYQIKQMKGFK